MEHVSKQDVFRQDRIFRCYENQSSCSSKKYCSNRKFNLSKINVMNVVFTHVPFQTATFAVLFAVLLDF